VVNSSGNEYLALRPLLRDFVMSMPRRGHRVSQGCGADPDPGRHLPRRDRRRSRCRVRGAVDVAAASDRSGGRLVSFERRDDFAEVARANVETFFG
jgi:tRNA (adenine57-N1/adenine58-N1)-methyltransferase